MTADAGQYPPGHAMLLLALLDYSEPPPKVTVVLAEPSEREPLPLLLPSDAIVILREPDREYPLKNGKTTFYVCRDHRCLPPVNEWKEE